jgi:hypothetical protein
MLTRLSTLAIGTAFVAIPVIGLFGRDSRQDDVGEHSEPKGIGADDRNVGKDANDRHHEDDKRHQKSKIHRGHQSADRGMPLRPDACALLA